MLFQFVSIVCSLLGALFNRSLSLDWYVSSLFWSFRISVLNFWHLVYDLDTLLDLLQRNLAPTKKWSDSMFGRLYDLTCNILDAPLFSINIWSIWLFVLPSGELHVCLCMFFLGKHVDTTTIFLLVAKFITRVPLLFESKCRLSLLMVG